MQQVMYFDGTTRYGPVSLPTALSNSGPKWQRTEKLDGSGTLSKITNEADGNACGYYKIQKATADPDMVIVSTAWPAAPNASNVFVQEIIEQITESEYEQRQKQSVRDSIAASMDEPIFQVIKKVVYALGKLHGMTQDQINTQISKYIDEVAAV